MAVISKNPLAYVLITDHDGKLTGLLTAGDLRRAKEKRFGDDVPVTRLLAEKDGTPYHTPFVAFPDTPPEDRLRMMYIWQLAFLPIVDPQGRVVAMEERAALEARLPLVACEAIYAEVENPVPDRLAKVARAAVPDGIGRGRRKIIMPYGAMLGVLGNMMIEMCYLKTLFDPASHDLIILRPPYEMPRTNRAAFDICMRDCFLVPCDDRELLRAEMMKLGIFESDDDLLILNKQWLYREVHRQRLEQGKTLTPFHLDDAEAARGRRLRVEAGIPDDRPLVILHVRESGFHSRPPWQAHNRFRDSSIERYIPVIRYLTSLGYAVVRLGDTSMKPLPDDLGPAVVDLALRPQPDRLLEIYLAATAAFMIHTASGPECYARTFGVPALTTNGQFFFSYLPGDNYLEANKIYFSHRLKRRLTYQEILSTLNFDWSVHFSELEIELIELSTEEILECLDEFLEMLSGKPQSAADQAMDRRIFDMSLAEHRRRHVDPKLASLATNFYGLALPTVRYSKRQLSRMPEFFA